MRNLSFKLIWYLIWEERQTENRENKMASQSQGIQQLLHAEKRAAEKVAEARKRKARRLRQAKEEAQGEIEQYRLEREKDFKHKQEAVSNVKKRLWGPKVTWQRRSSIRHARRSRQCRPTITETRRRSFANC
ncbi:V-type proton ATPase subunit G 3-like isoform X2 [Scyliorhinus torazame]|uniref:V-type proton ATPase subunit G 3-like isoform X2 n=1 Tax=Scyliorhinus torazame TaxID=75743 RepID=UPI003B5BFEC4